MRLGLLETNSTKEGGKGFPFTVGITLPKIASMTGIYSKILTASFDAHVRSACLFPWSPAFVAKSTPDGC